MNLNERLIFFINKCFRNQSNFAETLQIDKSTLNRYTSGKVLPNTETLIKFIDSGLSIDWLLSGHGSMFAKNPKGFELEIIYDDNLSEQIILSPFDRIKSWITENYSSIQSFAVCVDTDYNELNYTLTHDMVLDGKLIDCLYKGGCSIEWLSNGEGNPYANNPIGLILQTRKNKLLQENEKEMATDEFLKLISKVINADVQEQLKKGYKN